MIDRDALREFFPRRYEQSQSPKIITTGMRRFEAAWDESGALTAGISTVIVRDLPSRVFALALLTVLNSPVASFFFRECYRSLAIDAGVNFSRHNVATLPMPDLSGHAAILAPLARRVINGDDSPALIAEIDRSVCTLYGLEDRERMLGV